MVMQMEIEMSFKHGRREHRYLAAYGGRAEEGYYSFSTREIYLLGVQNSRRNKTLEIETIPQRGELNCWVLLCTSPRN
jgi:hypothetical protein